MPLRDYKFLLDSDHAAGVNGNTNSTNEINFGYTAPNVGAGNKFGAHIVITQAYTAMNSGMSIRIVHGAATAPTTKLAERWLSQTQLKVLGAHYFIPCPPGSLLQFARLQHIPTSENGTLGYITAWFGAEGDGAI